MKRNLHNLYTCIQSALRGSVLVLGFVFLTSCMFSEESANRVVFHTPQGEVSFGVDIVETQEDIERGLSGVTNLPKNKGMFFRFSGTDIRHFWMKEMRMPLDIIFVGNDGYVVHVLSKVQPCPEDLTKCPSYSSLHPARYVVEINAGLAEEYGIEPMTRMELLETVTN